MHAVSESVRVRWPYACSEYVCVRQPPYHTIPAPPGCIIHASPSHTPLAPTYHVAGSSSGGLVPYSAQFDFLPLPTSRLPPRPGGCTTCYSLLLLLLLLPVVM